MPNFYSVIIGTELLNGRRVDSHFEFLNAELIKRGFEQRASFVISDEPDFIEDLFNFIKRDKDSVLFSFGGIGSTPDDYTRAIASKVFSNSKLQIHKEALTLLEDKFKSNLNQNRLELINFPENSKLLLNPVNQIPGFYLEDRFFFTPGFPEMAREMVKFALDKFFPKNEVVKYRLSVKVDTSEGELIEFMKSLPDEIELSSLPTMDKKVDLSLASINKNKLQFHFDNLLRELSNLNINFKRY